MYYVLVFCNSVDPKLFTRLFEGLIRLCSLLVRRHTVRSELIKCVFRCFNRDFAAQKAALEGEVTILALHFFLFSCGVAHAQTMCCEDEVVKRFLQAGALPVYQ